MPDIMLTKKRAAARLFPVLVSLCLFAGGPVLAEEGSMMKVYMDHARILKLDRPVSKVIIGNSDIADATVADDRTIVLTGRKFGATNLVILDAEGNAIVDERVVVSSDEGNTLRVFRQTELSTWSCTPNCERIPEVDKAAAMATAPMAAP